MGVRCARTVHHHGDIFAKEANFIVTGDIRSCRCAGACFICDHLCLARYTRRSQGQNAVSKKVLERALFQA